MAEGVVVPDESVVDDEGWSDLVVSEDDPPPVVPEGSVVVEDPPVVDVPVFEPLCVPDGDDGVCVLEEEDSEVVPVVEGAAWVSVLDDPVDSVFALESDDGPPFD